VDVSGRQRTGRALALIALAVGALDCGTGSAQRSYAVPVAPYTPLNQSNATWWPVVPVGAAAASPLPSSTAPASSSGAWPLSSASAAPLATTTAPNATGPLLSADPEIDGPADVASVDIGAISMVGGTVSDASTEFARMHGTFRRCYRSALVFDFKVAGDMRLVAQIGAKGQVTDVVAEDVNGIPGGVVTCIVERVSNQVFARPTSIPATLRVPLRLLPMAPSHPHTQG
jgi:hypothetical protein